MTEPPSDRRRRDLRGRRASRRRRHRRRRSTTDLPEVVEARRGRRRRGRPLTDGRSRGRPPPRTARRPPATSGVAEPRRRRAPARPTRSRLFKDALRAAPGEWYVVHSYAGYENRVKANVETPHHLPEHGGLHLPGRGPAGRGRRDQERPAQARPPQQVPRLRAGPHGPHRRVLGRRPQHPRRHRLRRATRTSRRRSPSTRSSTSSAPTVEKKAHEKAEVKVLDFQVGDSVTVIDGPFTSLQATHQRDQRRHPADQGPGRDLRPGDPGRAVVLPDPEELVVHSTGSPALTEDCPMPPKKKLAAIIKLQINAGAATPAPPVGPALGQHGVNIMEFCKAVQRRDRGPARPGHPGRDLGLRGPLVHLRHQDPAGRAADPGGRRRREGLGRAAQDQGRQDHQGPGPRDRRRPRCPTSTPTTSTPPS